MYRKDRADQFDRLTRFSSSRLNAPTGSWRFKADSTESVSEKMASLDSRKAADHDFSHDDFSIWRHQSAPEPRHRVSCKLHLLSALHHRMDCEEAPLHRANVDVPGLAFSGFAVPARHTSLRQCPNRTTETLVPRRPKIHPLNLRQRPFDIRLCVN